MSRHAIEVKVPFPSDDVEMACREAVAQLGWQITNQSTSGLTCNQVTPQVTSFTNPVEVEVVWRQEINQTILKVSGYIFGFGPIQSSHLKGEMGNLLNRIQLCLRKASSERQSLPQSPLPQSTLSGELENLARLKSLGVLSDEEFIIAKAKLLGQILPVRNTP